QAEDGIRDFHVTGVQTCALPISRQVRRTMPNARFVFLAPPSFEELERRLLARGTEGPEERARRLRTAREELAAADEFDDIIVNDVVTRATDELVSLMGLPTE